MKLDAAAFRELYAHYSKRTAAGHLGARLVELDEAGIVLEMEISDRSRQPYGWLHGGVSLLLAEEAASTHAAFVGARDGLRPVGIELSGSHLRSAREGWIEVRAKLLRRGRHTAVHQVEVRHRDSGELLSVARVTNLYRPAREESTPSELRKGDSPQSPGT